MGLVVTFLGEALTLRLLHEVWPDQTGAEIDEGGCCAASHPIG